MNSFLNQLIIIALCAVPTIAKAQVYQLQSLDGRHVQLRLFYHPASHKFAICYRQDTLYLNDYWDHKARVLHGSFLEVAYTQRGGSNVGRGSTVLVCISHNKLVQALHIDSFSEYDMRNIFRNPGTLSEYELYTVKLTTQAKNKLLVRIHDEYSTEQEPALNRNSNRIFTLRFNPSKHIFYNCTRRIAGQLVSYKKGTELPSKRKFTGYAPAVQLGKEEYDFIKGVWYSRGKGKSSSVYYRVD